MHSNIKVRTIVNIIRVNNQYESKIGHLERECEYYKRNGDMANFNLTKAQLDKTKSEHGEFLDFYI